LVNRNFAFEAISILIKF